MVNEGLNSLKNAQERIKTACDALCLEPAVYEILKQPQRTIEISIPVKMDNGSIKVFKGYRAVYNDAIGPAKGGIRFHPEVSLDEVRALSAWMTIKCGVMGLPYGGSKGGIAVDPSTLSQSELERLSRGYIQGLHKYLGEKVDIPAPDVGSNGQIMAWMIDEYNRLTGGSNLGAITGKPIGLGGSEGRTEATGFGISVIAREAVKKIKIEMKNARVAVQGFGNVGSYTVKNLQEQGAIIVAVGGWSPTRGSYALYDKNGLDFADMKAYRDEHRHLIGYPNAKVLYNVFWEIDTDILIPAALENAITAEIAGKINTKLICEAANGPITPEADKILKKRGILVTPDILTNAGGVIGSYFEWVQNQYGYYWEEEKVKRRLEAAMINAFKDIWKLKLEKDTTIREAAYMISVKRIADVMKLRGWY